MVMLVCVFQIDGNCILNSPEADGDGLARGRDEVPAAHTVGVVARIARGCDGST